MHIYAHRNFSAHIAITSLSKYNDPECVCGAGVTNRAATVSHAHIILLLYYRNYTEQVLIIVNMCVFAGVAKRAAMVPRAGREQERRRPLQHLQGRRVSAPL